MTECDSPQIPGIFGEAALILHSEEDELKKTTALALVIEVGTTDWPGRRWVPHHRLLRSWSRNPCCVALPSSSACGCLFAVLPAGVASYSEPGRGGEGGSPGRFLPL